MPGKIPSTAAESMFVVKVPGPKPDLVQKRLTPSTERAGFVDEKGEINGNRPPQCFPQRTVYKKIFLFKDFVLPLHANLKVMDKLVKI